MKYIDLKTQLFNFSIQVFFFTFIIIKLYFIFFVGYICAPNFKISIKINYNFSQDIIVYICAIIMCMYAVKFLQVFLLFLLPFSVDGVFINLSGLKDLPDCWFKKKSVVNLYYVCLYKHNIYIYIRVIQKVLSLIQKEELQSFKRFWASFRKKSYFCCGNAPALVQISVLISMQMRPIQRWEVCNKSKIWEWIKTFWMTLIYIYIYI